MYSLLFYSCNKFPLVLALINFISFFRLQLFWFSGLFGFWLLYFTCQGLQDNVHGFFLFCSGSGLVFTWMPVPMSLCITSHQQ